MPTTNQTSQLKDLFRSATLLASVNAAATAAGLPTITADH